MTDTNKKKIEDVLVQDLGDTIPFYEIRNTIEVMSTYNFDTSGINKTVLQEALLGAMDYLNSITLPIYEQAMNAVYKQKVFIAMDNIKKSLTA